MLVLREYIQEIKEKDKDCYFGRFIFVGNINFKKDLSITVFKSTNFKGAIFKGNTDFGGTIFKGNTNFQGTIFEGNINFKDAIFEGDTNFQGADLRGYRGSFNRVTFKKDANFEFVSFTAGFTNFQGATFRGVTVFKIVGFDGDSSFKDAIFEGHSSFEGVTFEGDADFQIKYFRKNLNFSKINVLSGKRLNLKLENDEGNITLNDEGNITFERAYLENVYLDVEFVEGTLIDFFDALLKNTKIKREQIEDHIFQEKNKEFSEAQQIYLILKNNFHSIGQYKNESWAYTKERDMERMSQSFYSFLNKYRNYSLFKKILMKSNVSKRVIIKTKIFSKWLFSKKAFEWFHLSFSNFIYQYGESPRRVIRFALIIIFLFALILNLSGIVNSDRTNVIIEFIKKSQGDEYTLRYLGPILGNFLDCLYFSVVTFTTLGYGDFQPAVGVSRFFVSLESIIGAFTMALFVYTFARRTGGR